MPAFLRRLPRRKTAWGSSKPGPPGAVALVPKMQVATD
jgi:hypothetical protein